ncbi:MAG: hypothetical protein JWM82_1571, partial [Myxococcales bacterium]|nr:hypothetical protein [Myxococcales bacterium]
AGVGAYFGLAAMGKENDAESRCPTSPHCADAAAIGLTNQARTDAALSTVGFLSGAALVAAGMYLFFAGSPGSQKKVLVPSIAIDHKGWSASLTRSF